jgi:hypothetical protein
MGGCSPLTDAVHRPEGSFVLLSLAHVQSLVTINEVKLPVVVAFFPCWRFEQHCLWWRLGSLGARDGSILVESDGKRRCV